MPSIHDPFLFVLRTSRNDEGRELFARPASWLLSLLLANSGTGQAIPIKSGGLLDSKRRLAAHLMDAQIAGGRRGSPLGFPCFSVGHGQHQASYPSYAAPTIPSSIFFIDLWEDAVTSASLGDVEVHVRSSQDGVELLGPQL